MSSSGDQYRNFRFRVKWNGKYVAGFREIAALPEKTKKSVQWQSGSPRPSVGPEGPGTPFFFSLEHGVSFDLGFEQWLSIVRSYGPATGKGPLLREYPRTLTVEAYGESGEIEYAYHLTGCWVTEYKAVPGPDISANEITIGHLKFGCGSWERDPREER